MDSVGLAALSGVEYGVYYRWDKLVSTAQKSEIYSARCLSSSAPGAIDTDNVDGVTATQYIQYDLTEGATGEASTVNDLQYIRVVQKFGAQAGAGNESTRVPACYRQRMWGRLSPDSASVSLVSGKSESVVTFNTPGGTPDATTSTDVDGTSGSGDGSNDTSNLSSSEEVADYEEFANGTTVTSGAHTFNSSLTTLAGGTPVPGPGDFDWTCDDVTNGKSLLFSVAGTVVDFDATPSEVFD
jgi:hypothetical protein